MNVDTLSIARDLRAADLPVEQAEAIAAAIGPAVAESSATKADLQIATSALEAKMEQGRNSLDSKIEHVRAGLHTEIERARNQVLVGLIGSQIGFAGLIIAAAKLL